MNAQHTPGPWNINAPKGGKHLIESKKGCIAIISEWSENKEADARLLAAAPEQHDANVKTLDFLRRLSETGAVNEYAAHMVDELNALIEQNASAISKAKGE